MEIQVFNSLDDILPYRDIWDGILSDIDSNIVYAKLEWLYMWWQYHGRDIKPFILTLIEDGEIVGFCPLMKVSKRGYEEIRFIGGDEAGSMEFIIKKAYRVQGIEKILDYLINMNGRFVINLHGLLKGYDGYYAVKQYLSNNKWHFFETSLKCFYTNIDAQNFYDYMRKQLSRKSIGTMKRKENRLKRLGRISFSPFEGGADELETIFDIHDRRWQRKIGSSKFSEGATREFFKELVLAKGLPFKVHVDIIDLDGRTISFIYGFEYKGRYTFYRIGHDDNFGMFSPGEMVLREKIRDCFEKGICVFDFGLGYEPYKAMWASNSLDVANFVFPANNLFSRLVYNIRRIKLNIRQFLKGIPWLYHFVKYKLGKFKFLLYPDNIKRSAKRAFRTLRDRGEKVLTFIYWRQNYYIMRKNLKQLRGDGGRVYKVEETSAAGQLELLLDITRMEAQDILRRFLKGDRCILVYTHRDIHCLWFDLSDMNISKIRYSCPMDKGSVFLYEHGTVGREKKLNRHVLYSALEYLKKAGFNACCIAVREKNHLLINQLKREGFKKIRYVRYTKWFGKPACRVYQ